MASEEHVDLSVQLPPELGEWLRERAEDEDTSPNDLLQQLVSAYRTVSRTNGDGAEFDVASLSADRVEELDERLDDQRDEYVELVEDVRERVIQVKRETDQKAPASHAHEDLTERLADLESAVDDVDALRDDVADVSADLDAGFENYEEILRYLTETTDELDAKLTTLAQVTVDLREEVTRLAGAEARRAEVDALRLAANREGIDRAKCDECSAMVRIGLLTEPRCPQCASSFSDVEASDSFGPFGSNRLLTGEPPALPGAGEPDLGDSFEETFFEDDGDDDAPEFEEEA